MAAVIRLTRRGRRHAPFYRIGVFDTRTRRDGASIENLGFYDPIAKGEVTELELDVERAKYWISVGATPSETVASLFRQKGVATSLVEKRRTRNRKRTSSRLVAEKASGKVHGKSRRKEQAKKKAAAKS